MADLSWRTGSILAVAKDCVIVVYVNQSQQSISPCFGQSANHGVCWPYALARDLPSFVFRFNFELYVRFEIPFVLMVRFEIFESSVLSIVIRKETIGGG